MSHAAGASLAHPPIYPRRYFDLSPTWFRWNRLTARDVHGLRAEPGFQGQNVYFHLNHPIRFVRVVGVVLEMECFGDGKFTVVHLDDGSGECIAVRIMRLADESFHPGTENTGQRDRWLDATAMENVRVEVNMGLPTVFVDDVRVNVGSVLRVKGTITMWRRVKQLDVKILAMVGDTQEELRTWMDTARWKSDCLMKPWVLADTAMVEYDEKLRKEQIEAAEQAQKKKEKRSMIREKRARYELAHEQKRLREEKMMNEGALLGADLIREPWG